MLKERSACRNCDRVSKKILKDAPYAGERTMSLDGVYSIKVPNNLQFVKPTQNQTLSRHCLENPAFCTAIQ